MELLQGLTDDLGESLSIEIMILENTTKRLLRYNLWANERLTNWLAGIERDLLYRETGSGFGTVDLTLQHILSAEIYWYTIIFKGQINDFNQPVKLNAVERVMADLVDSSKRLLDHLARFTEQQLIETINASDSSQSRYEYILHLVIHGSYHRGQIVYMCRALNIPGEIPVTDYDGYLWWIENM